MTAPIRISCGDSDALIERIGAELIDWRVGGRPLLWRADPAIWDRTSPILFPIVGRVRDGKYRIGDRWYELGTHGFAASSKFDVAATAEDAVRLELRDNDETRAAYPFPFQLSVEYRALPRALETTIEVSNTGDEPLPYAAGWHPGFALPFSDTARAGHAVEFERDEVHEVPEITSAGLFAASRRQLPFNGRRLAITDDLMAREALCFLDVKSRALTLEAPDKAAILFEVENFPHLALWNRDTGPFLCIEAWTGHGDPDGYDGDFHVKPSMRLLLPGAIARHKARVSFSPAA